MYFSIVCPVRFVPTVVFMASQLVRSVGFSSDGALFAAGSNDCALRVCRTPSESEMALAHGGYGSFYQNMMSDILYFLVDFDLRTYRVLLYMHY